MKVPRESSSEKETNFNIEILNQQRAKTKFRAEEYSENNKSAQYFKDRAESSLKLYQDC